MSIANYNWDSVQPWLEKYQNWGDMSIVKPTLVDALFEVCSFTKKNIFLSHGTTGKHMPGSEHETGEAGDILFPELMVGDTFDLFIAISRFPRITSIGMYNYWQYNRKPCPGFHIGVRSQPVRKLWMWVMVEGKPREKEINFNNIVYYGLGS